MRNGIAPVLPRNGGSQQGWSRNVALFSFCSLIYSNKISPQRTTYYNFANCCAHLQFCSTKQMTASGLTPRDRNKYERNSIFTIALLAWPMANFHNCHALNQRNGMSSVHSKLALHRNQNKTWKQPKMSAKSLCVICFFLFLRSEYKDHVGIYIFVNWLNTTYNSIRFSSNLRFFLCSLAECLISRWFDVSHILNRLNSQCSTSQLSWFHWTNYRWHQFICVATVYFWLSANSAFGISRCQSDYSPNVINKIPRNKISE